MICILQLQESQLAEKNRRIQLPDYLTVSEEITDMPEFQPAALAKAIFNIDEEKKASSGDEK